MFTNFIICERRLYGKDQGCRRGKERIKLIKRVDNIFKVVRQDDVSTVVRVKRGFNQINNKR